jgi:purine-binding chemotaxis protein CheW
MSGPDDQGLAHLDLERATDEAPEELRRLIMFEACDEWFGLPIEWVREIQPLERVTRVPNAPAGVLGILNLRGRILTLFDLAGCLGIPPGTRPNTYTVVLEFADQELHVGLAVQRMVQMRRIAPSGIEPPSREGVLGGVFEMDGQVVGLLDLSRLFARALSEWGLRPEVWGTSDRVPGER